MADSFSTPWTVVRQALLSMRFPRQEYWSGLLFPTPGDLPDQIGIKSVSPALKVDSLLLSHQREATYIQVKNFSSFYPWQHFKLVCSTKVEMIIAYVENFR